MSKPGDIVDCKWCGNPVLWVMTPDRKMILPVEVNATPRATFADGTPIHSSNDVSHTSLCEEYQRQKKAQDTASGRLKTVRNQLTAVQIEQDEINQAMRKVDEDLAPLLDDPYADTEVLSNLAEWMNHYQQRWKALEERRGKLIAAEIALSRVLGGRQG